MKKQLIRRSVMIAIALLLTAVPVIVLADTAGDNVSQIVYYLRRGNVSAAQTYNQQLPETAAAESCVTNMPQAMKTAYKNKVKSIENVTKYGSFVFMDYWLTDLDNDGSAELLLNLGPDYASAMTHVYKYQGGQAVEVGSFSGNETCHAYPGHNGIITEGGKMGSNWLSLVTLENGQINKEELISYGNGNLSGDEYFNMRNRLKSHAKWNGDRYVPLYADLGGDTPAPVKVASTSITNLLKGKKSFTVKWKKLSGVSGYQIQYGTKSSFKGAKTVTVKKASTGSRKFKRLKARKKYYVRVRAYKTVNGKRYYSAWSKKRHVKTK